MPETAESHSHHIETNRNCTIEITNVSSVFCLNNPKVHMDSGFCFSPPQPTVRTNMTEVCSFTKDDSMATGVAGVLTYELFDMHQRCCNELIAIMFSVPFDYNLYENWLGVGIYPSSRACDKDLFKEMYYDKEPKCFKRHESDGSGVKFQLKAVDVRACMSDEGRAIVKVEVHDRMD